MAFNLFPYTNFHKLNLDWILSKVKEALTAAHHAEQSAAAAEQAVSTAQQAAETAQAAAEAAQQAAEAAQADVDTLDTNAVQYVPQERSDALQAQARANISAASVAYVDQQPHVPDVAAGDSGKVLTAGADGYAWEVPLAISGTADVLVVTITESDGTYSADKTYAQVAQAFTAGWPVLFRLGNQLAPDLSLTAEGWKAVGLDNEYNRLIITLASDNTVTVSTAALPVYVPLVYKAVLDGPPAAGSNGSYTINGDFTTLVENRERIIITWDVFLGVTNKRHSTITTVYECSYRHATDTVPVECACYGDWGDVSIKLKSDGTWTAT